MGIKKKNNIQQKITVVQLEKAINIPAEKWEGRCHDIADDLLATKLTTGILRYGHWLGPVHKKSMFRKISDASSISFVRHGWIEREDGSIVDPTRWAFENKKPYIFQGLDDEGYYDAGGNKLREAMQRPAPVFDIKDPEVKPRHMDGECKLFALHLLGHPKFTKSGMFWLANLPMNVLGMYARGVYNLIIDVGLGAYIPYDNREIVETMGDAPEYPILK